MSTYASDQEPAPPLPDSNGARQPGRVRRGRWQGAAGREHARRATRRMFADLGWSGLSGEEVAQRLTYATFSEHSIDRMLRTVYNSSPYAALHDLFPSLRPWQMKQTPNRYWKGDSGREHAREATRWLIERLGLGSAAGVEVAAQITQREFDRLGLRGMLEIVYGDSPYAALVELYPGLRPWQMGGGALVAYWQGQPGREHARVATRWLVEQLGLAEAAPGEVAGRVVFETFARFGLSGMLEVVYGNSPHAALADVYPGLYPWEMARAPRDYWSGPEGRTHARAATRWMLERLGLAGVDFVEAALLIERAAFKRLHLGGMLEQVYENNHFDALYEALNDLYSESLFFLDALLSAEAYRT